MSRDRTQIRSEFAARLSRLYGSEVPAYLTLVEVSQQVNRRVLSRDGVDAERLGSISRVTAERHGAIRVGTPRELGQVARIFAAMGMHPTGFYDLRDAKPNPIPVVSTAFRPVDRQELAVNPFRVFTSMLVPGDRRFFSADLQQRLETFLNRRRLFPEELLTLADRAIAYGGLDDADAERFLRLAVQSFALSPEPVDRAWYTELERVSSVAADVGGVATTHINHLTPRVLDIDELYAAMSDRGIEMIDAIQGPPRWAGPDVLLRQTSFKALAEPRRFRDANGQVSDGELRVRFGEVEARGIALTRAGREEYDRVTALVDHACASRPELARQIVAADVWSDQFPTDERDWHDRGLAFFRYAADPVAGTGLTRPRDLAEALSLGWVRIEPIVYEDFLPRSAAGIFASNLTSRPGDIHSSESSAQVTMGWLADAVGADIHVPEDLYEAESKASLDSVLTDLGLPPG